MSTVNLYWLRVLETGGLLTFLSVARTIVPTLCLSVLGAGGFGSALRTEALDFQMDPIFDWTILPLYMPGAGFDGGTAAGRFGASAAIFLAFTACSARRAWLCVCCCLTTVAAAAAPFLSLCTVFTCFRASLGFDLVSGCLALALRGPFFAIVSSFLLLFGCKGAADVVALLMKDLLPYVG